MDDRVRPLVAILLLIIWVQEAHGIIGYDCGSSTANITTLSLLNIEECDIPQQKVDSTKVYVQLLQLNDFQSVKVIQCKVEIDRLIRKCGMFSHTMDVFNGKFSYIQEVTLDACRRMHTLGSIQIANTIITGLKSNQTTSRPMTFAGDVDSTGACSGGAYTDPYGSWTDVIVIGTIRITLQDYIADVRINVNRVQLRSGITCELSATTCIDMEGGDTFWDSIPHDSCSFSKYSILYEGYADKITDNASQFAQPIYSLKSQDTLFALTANGQNMVCGHPLIKTEHPKLIIFETQPGIQIFRRSTQASNLDIFTYMNSKFVYVERHIRTQLNQLYQNILTQQCNLERQTLQNALAIATQSPDIFAYHLMKGPGYMALVAGEVIHIIKCVPVEVKIIHKAECYQQLTVNWSNKTYFLTPQTHILLKQGTQINCNPLAPIMYLLEDSWYKITPRPVDTRPPISMKPLTKPTWKYVNPGSLATSGIYTDTDLETLRDHIMFPAERPAVLNTVARGVMGQSTILQGGSIANLMDEASIEKIAISTWEKFWNKFLIFGNISAGFLAVYMIIRAAKLLLDTLVHGYALHTVYGWSLYLLGAIWDSVTNLLLHLGMRRPREGNADEENNGGPSRERDSNETATQSTIETSFITPQAPPNPYPTLPLQETTTFNFKLKE